MDVLDTKDKKEADDILRGEDKIEDAAKDIAKTVHAVRAKAAPAKKKTKVRMRALPVGAVRYDDTAAQALCPPESRFRSDARCRRFQVFYKQIGFSRSWGKWGEAEAFRLVIQWAWRMHTLATGEEHNFEGLDK